MLAVASTWTSGSDVAYAGVFLFMVPIPFTWPPLDAAFSRYANEPLVSAPAQSRLHWVICVLLGVFLSIVIGALAAS